MDPSNKGAGGGGGGGGGAGGASGGAGGGGAGDDWGASTMVKIVNDSGREREAEVWVKRADGVAQAIKVEVALPRDIHPLDYKVGFSFCGGEFVEGVPGAVIEFTVEGEHDESSGSHDSNAEYLDDEDADDESKDRPGWGEEEAGGGAQAT